ncbi:YwqG family protein [Candidatus Phycorickettsia trachydisci]|uniref:DUF1963 domain-containing protein n=1 Tax=Candidatus Phycorickettsia trachydisci TaxID=2115978 RepID=UPI00131A5264|nr:DUF1963 domain-containing protein [Candidatus Phycorickettsia trachydisci]
MRRWGTYLSPIIQLHIPELKKVPYILKDLDYLMIFLHSDGYYYNSNEDHIPIRAYRKGSKLVPLQKPQNVICNPLLAKFEEIDDYPSDDMPTGLSQWFHGQDNEDIYTCCSDSKVGGWPRWIQTSELCGKYQFVLQIDASGEEYWEWGDCPILYIFRHIVKRNFHASTQFC